MTDDERSPGELVRAAAGGDEGAWNDLVGRFVRPLWGIALSYRLSESETADAVQTTWLRLVENLSRIRDPDRVGGWLATTVRNECLIALRRLGRERPATTDWFDVPDTRIADPDAALVRTEQSAQLRMGFAGLSRPCQDLLRLLTLSDPPMSYRQISTELSVPVGSIGPTRARCLERLRRNYDSAGTADGAVEAHDYRGHRAAK